MRGAIPLPEYAFMAWCSVKKHFKIHNYIPRKLVLSENLVVTQLVKKVLAV
jgi:hypothetical protein